MAIINPKGPYKVLYYSTFFKGWREYEGAATHSSGPTRYDTAEEARRAVAYLDRYYPRDRFMVEGPDAAPVTEPSSDTPEHTPSVQGDEYFCARCGKRWDINDKETPPCTG